MTYPTHLPPDEIARLVPLAQAGDLKARNRIVLHNMRFVVQQAQKLARRTGRSDLLEDMIQAGVVGSAKEEYGLTRAIRSYDPSRGLAFSTYARSWIHAAQLAVLSGGSAIQQPRSVFGRSLGVRRIADALTERLGRAPTVDEIRAVYEERGITVPSRASIKHALDSRHISMVPLDAHWTLNRDAYAGDKTDSLEMRLPSNDAPADEALGKAQTLERLRAAIAQHLTPVEQYVIRKRFGLGDDADAVTLRDIGIELERSHERVRQLQAQALRKLRLVLGDGVTF